MKKQTKYLFLFVLLPLLCDCAIHLNDSTAYSPPWYAGTPVTFKVDVSKDLLVIPQTINASVTIDGQTFPMQGSGTGEWHYVHNAEPCISNIDYRFTAKGMFLALPLPIPLPTEEAHEPEGSYASVPITGSIGVGPSSISIYCNAGSESCKRTVTITNRKPGTELTIESIIIGPCIDCTGVGLHSGEGFGIPDRPSLPQTLLCGEKLEFSIVAYRAHSYTIQNGRLDIEYTHNGAPSMNSISLSAQVFFP